MKKVTVVKEAAGSTARLHGNEVKASESETMKGKEGKRKKKRGSDTAKDILLATAQVKIAH